MDSILNTISSVFSHECVSTYLDAVNITSTLLLFPSFRFFKYLVKYGLKIKENPHETFCI